MSETAPTVQMQAESNVATIQTQYSKPTLDVPSSVAKAGYGSGEDIEQAA